MTSTRELDFRSTNGLEVALLWEPETNRVSVSVSDRRSGDDFTLDVDPAKALDAFHHPYAFSDARSVRREAEPTPV